MKGWCWFGCRNTIGRLNRSGSGLGERGSTALAVGDGAHDADLQRRHVGVVGPGELVGVPVGVDEGLVLVLVFGVCVGAGEHGA